MLKRTKFVYATLMILLLMCLLFDVMLEEKTVSYLACAYFFVFVLLSIFLIIRGFVYKVDTNIYFGIMLLISPISQLLINYDIFSVYAFLLVCSSVIAFASLVIWWYFKDKTHKLLFFIFLGEILIFLTPFYLTNLSIWYLIVIAIVWLVLAIIFNVVKKKFKRR